MSFDWLALVPPCLVLLLGFMTRNVVLSLASGIMCAALIATHGAPYATLSLIATKLWNNAEFAHLASVSAFWTSNNLFIGIFLCMLGILVTLITYAGGAYACGLVARQHIHTTKGAETTSLLLSAFFFIDDYFSSLTVGSVMHPITDQFKIPRVKLAFLVDAMAAPLAILCPLSSWVAAIVGFLTENGVSASNDATTLIVAEPFWIYLRILPFLFYSLCIVAGAWFIVRWRISFGAMRQQELIAQTTGNVFGGKDAVAHTIRDADQHIKDSASLMDFLVPVAILLVSLCAGMLYSGGHTLFGGTHSFIFALQHSKASLALFVGGCLALVTCTLYFVLRRRITLRALPRLYVDGIMLMVPALLVLLLAWTLGDILRDDLHTGQYVASLVAGSLPVYAMPALFFVLSLLTSFAIGSSWGTIAIFMPIAIPMLLTLLATQTPVVITEHVYMLFPLLGAIFSGAVAGDHVSPISDTTVMSSVSTGSHHIDHVRTQLTYTAPIIVGTFVAFVCAGVLIPHGFFIASIVPTLMGIAVGCSLLWLLGNAATQQNKNT